MLYEILNNLNINVVIPYEISQNLNPKFELREYQKEALKRFIYYLSTPDLKKQNPPYHLLYNMATGSGKTLIMAALILQLYQQGYRHFIYFVNSVNVIAKTKDNFLNQLSEKYLFAPKIKFKDKEVYVKEVQNFETSNQDDINIIFTTIQELHIRLNTPKENSLTYEDFKDKKIVLLSDEAHHLQTLTKGNKEESELERSWEFTVKQILNSNIDNILLEFTATIDLNVNDIRQKYEDKIIYQYNLKQFRIDKYSKEIEVLQADLEPVERALQAVILSQYRRKIAERNGVHPLKPVILLKSRSIKESKENYDKFMSKLKTLTATDIEKIENRTKGTDISKIFKYFQKENISFENLIKELQEDFSEEKCILLDSENIDEEKQLKLNSLEAENNEIRAIFAVNMLNEGWDVLNLFDIVRLFDTRDGKHSHSGYKPGPTTISEAQLIGRGARYFPFQLNEAQDKYKRKFDDDLNNEIRILETLYYHSAHNPRYIDEIKSTLKEMGILEDESQQIEINFEIKESFKKTDFWKKGYVYINDRIPNPRIEIKSLIDARIDNIYEYKMRTGKIITELILSERNEIIEVTSEEQSKITYNLMDFGENVIRNALDKIEFYSYENLKKYFPYIKSIKEFINSKSYLGGVEINVIGLQNEINNLNQKDKLDIVLDISNKIANSAKINTAEYIGSTKFKNKLLQNVFKDKMIRMYKGDQDRKEMKNIQLVNKDWFAHNQFYGTDEEQNFINFIDSFINTLREKYSDIALLRNENYFQIFDFDEGRAFEPDFLLLLKHRNKIINIYQIFVEAKGNQFKDSQGRFENSKEGWKQKFLLDIEQKANLENNIFEYIDGSYHLLGLPFYNEDLKNEFTEALENKILK